MGDRIGASFEKLRHPEGARIYLAALALIAGTFVSKQSMLVPTSPLQHNDEENLLAACALFARLTLNQECRSVRGKTYGVLSYQGRAR